MSLRTYLFSIAICCMFLQSATIFPSQAHGRETAELDENQERVDGPSKDDLLRFMDASARQAKPTLLPQLLKNPDSLQRLSRLTEAELYKLFMFDLRRMARELAKQLESGILEREDLHLLDPNDFFELELSIEGLKSNLWNSRTEEVIYNDGHTKVTRIYHDWYEVEDLATSSKSEIILMSDHIWWFYGDGEGIDLEFGDSGEPTALIEALLEIFNIDPDSDAADELRLAAAKEAEGQDDGAEEKPESTDAGKDETDKPETSDGGTLVDDFVEEAQKAWELFVEMVDDAVDYGPDYVDPNDPIIKYVAGLHRLTDLYMEIKLNAIINSDRTTNPMSEIVSDDEWLRMMLVVAFYRPTPDSDPVDRPQREDYELSTVGLDFDGAIDYGEDHFPSDVDPDDIPTSPVGL